MRVPSYQEAYAAYQSGDLAPWELVSCYVIEDLRRMIGKKWLQGKRGKAFPSSGSELMATLATHRMYKLPELASSALCHWSTGKRKINLLFSMPSSIEILRLQARGERCVSLIPASEIPSQYEGQADFVSHDLCHVEKFYDPKEYTAQVGFFFSLLRMVESPQWRELTARFDEKWQREFEHVAADMNGSPIFLWLSLKAAIRPALHRMQSPERDFDFKNESDLTRDALSSICDWFGLEGGLKRDALLINERGSYRDECIRMHQHLTSLGEQILTRHTAD